MKPFINRYLSERGQGLVEYALILSLVALMALIGVTLFGNQLSKTYEVVVGEMTSFGGQGGGTYCSSEMSSLDGWDLAGGNRKDKWYGKDGKVCNNHAGGSSFAFSECSQSEDMTNPEDYVIQLEDAVLTQGHGYGVMFRLQNYDKKPNGYAFQYDRGMRGLVFRKWVKGREVRKPLASVRLRNYEWYDIPRDITIRVVGNEMSAYIDGELVLSATDGTYSKGGVGLRTWGKTKVCFDKFGISSAAEK
ncbi:MAG: DUF1080 domain-containing protein [Anaerolineaceae bacterium]|nr:DUF1080 domain-containing protein [Anaerolineaceae bacterium]